MALILIVDDEQPIRHVLGEWVRRAGHEVAEADSSPAAIEAMEKRAADVVFTDIQMPGRDGRWLTGELRRRYPTTPVIIATSVGNMESEITLQWGVVSYLVKPFEPKTVERALKMALDWRKQTVESGAQPADTHERLEEWLASLDML